MKKIILPKTFTRKIWEKNSNPDYEKYIGMPSISYSQINNFLSAKDFNHGIKGSYGYIRQYFLGETFPSGPFAEFGVNIENYICDKVGKDLFTESERKVLDTVETLGIFQDEMVMDMGNGYVIRGFLDDRKEDYTEIVDYKSASEKSMLKFFEPSYIQLPIYSMWVLKTQKVQPRAFVKIIERIGGGEVFSAGAGIECMSVGQKVWKHEVDVTPTRLAEVEKIIQTTIEEISSLYSVFLKMEKQFAK